MSTSPFMDDYSSEDYSDHDDDYYFVPTATSPPQVRAQVEIQTQSNELQNLIIDQQEHVSESVYFDVLPELEAEAAEEGGGMGQSIYLAVESYFDLEAQSATGVAAAALEAETVVEELAVESYFYLEAQVETALPDALETETGLEEGHVIESESLETVEADTEVETVESMIEESIYEAVESESDLEAEGAIEEPISEAEDEADADAPEAETEVEEGDVIGESIYETMGSDYDLGAEAEDVVEEAEDMFEEEVEMVEEEEDMVEAEGDMVEEENGMVEEEDDMVEEEHDVTDEGDAIDEPPESDKNLQAQAEALVEEGAAMEESIYEPLESNSDIQAEAPEALAEPAVSIEMTTFEAQEPDSDLEPEGLIDEQLDSCEEESESSEEEWDSDADDSDMDSPDSDPNEEEEDDVVVSYFKSSTTTRSKAWNIWVPASALAWAKLPITDTTTSEISSLQESFVGCRPMLMLQECGNAVMNAIETLMCELLRIRNGLRRVLGALFRKKETTKHA